MGTGWQSIARQCSPDATLPKRTRGAECLCGATRISFHCQAIASKGYEAATAQSFIAQHNCAGKLITAEALHTRPRFCRQIRRQQGEHLLLVKRNRAELEAEIGQLFALPSNSRFPVQRVRDIDYGHG